jgi:hypothetical protein
MAVSKKPIHMPRNVQKRIVERSAKGQTLVVVPRKGKPSRVYKLDKYLKMMEQPKKHKPWSYRRQPATQADPLGAIDGSVRSTLRRRDIYR